MAEPGAEAAPGFTRSPRCGLKTMAENDLTPAVFNRFVTDRFPLPFGPDASSIGHVGDAASVGATTVSERTTSIWNGKKTRVLDHESPSAGLASTHSRRTKRLKHRGAETTEKEKDESIVMPDEKLKIFGTGNLPIRLLFSEMIPTNHHFLESRRDSRLFLSPYPVVSLRSTTG